MQKIYQRINWENDPSTNTPINEDNLNKMDYAIDTLDSRVVLLYGYQDRVAQSEKNAKTSETNAKESETNAKQSEIKAKEYMESAFNASQEGYEALVEKVERMDIKTSNKFELRDTKNGGYRLLEMSGATVQNGEPNPSNPQPIENVGDCVEMIQGKYNHASSGVYAVDSLSICTKNAIPCKPSDVVKLKFEKPLYARMVYFNGKNYVDSVASTYALTEHTFTIPSGVTHFHYNAVDTVALPLETVGKITLTVNGKYVVQIRERWKNFAKNEFLQGSSNDFNSTSRIRLKELIAVKKGVPVTLSATDYENYQYVINSTLTNGYPITNFTELGNNVTWVSKSITFTPNQDGYITVVIANKDNSTITPSSFKGEIQVEFNSIPTEIEPYTEKVATIFLNEPLRDADRIVRVDGVINENRKVVKEIYDGTKGTYITSGKCHYVEINEKPSREYLRAVCSHFKYVQNWDSVANGTEDNIFTVYSNSAWTNTRLAFYSSQFETVEDFKTWLKNNPIIVERELATPTLTPLDTESQLALNGLVTFKDMTYLEVDSKIKPSGIKGEYGTSQVGAYTLKCMNDNDTDRVERAELKARLDELAVALVSQ